MIDRGLTCRELVELVTDYLEGALTPSERVRFELHISICADCTTYLDQMRATVAAVGKLPAESIPPASRDELLRAFRDWHGH